MFYYLLLFCIYINLQELDVNCHSETDSPLNYTVLFFYLWFSHTHMKIKHWTVDFFVSLHGFGYEKLGIKRIRTIYVYLGEVVIEIVFVKEKKNQNPTQRVVC